MVYPSKVFSTNPDYYMFGGYPLFEGKIDIGRIYTMPELTEHAPGVYHWILNGWSVAEQGEVLINEFITPDEIVIVSGTRILIEDAQTNFIITVFSPAINGSQETSVTATHSKSGVINEIRSELVAPDTEPYVYILNSTTRTVFTQSNYTVNMVWNGNGKLADADKYYVILNPKPSFQTEMGWTGDAAWQVAAPTLTTVLSSQTENAVYRVLLHRGVAPYAISNEFVFGSVQGGMQIIFMKPL